MRAILLLAILATGMLSGCLGAENSETNTTDPDSLEPLSEATFGFGEFLRYRVPSFDGTLLHVDVQLPDGEGPFPLLLSYTPYSILGEEIWGAANDIGQPDLYGLGLADRYVKFGYAVAVAHVRGTGESEGCLTVGAEVEGRDGYAIVEEMANQSWSSGKIAMMGTSYVGTTPIETAVWNPPHLTTIIPISAVTDWYRYYFENGEQRVNGSPPPGASYPDPLFWVAMGVTPGLRTGTVDANDASCPAEMMQNFWLQDDLNSYWKARNHGARASEITAPTLYVQGWLDENVATNMMTDFFPALTTEKRAWLMQHGHGVSGSKTAYFEYEHRWLDHFLMGKDNGALLLPPVIIEDNQGKWRAEQALPISDAASAQYFLGAGSLDYEPKSGAGTFTDDPTETIATHKLSFVSPALESDQVFSGEMEIHLVASSSAMDTQFSVFLYDESPDGTRTFVTRAYLDARHRESLESGKDLVPGTKYEFDWTSHPRDHRFVAGHKFVLEVKSSDAYIIPDAPLATNAVFFGESWIKLPILANERLPMDSMAELFPTLFS